MRNVSLICYLTKTHAFKRESEYCGRLRPCSALLEEGRGLEGAG